VVRAETGTGGVMEFGKVSRPFWDDRPVAVIGGGPSMQDFNFEELRGAHVLAVKASIFSVPWADAGFVLGASPAQWRDRLATVQARVYWAVPEDQIEPPPAKNVTLLKRLGGLQPSDDPSMISGGTSGFGALQVCIHKRAKQIVLFGFDYDGSTGVGASPKRRENSAAHWAAWAEHFRVFVPYFTAHDIRIVNANPASAITCFQKVALRDGVAICAHGTAVPD
jgi:hypothetical protein